MPTVNQMVSLLCRIWMFGDEMRSLGSPSLAYVGRAKGTRRRRRAATFLRHMGVESVSSQRFITLENFHSNTCTVGGKTLKCENVPFQES